MTLHDMIEADASSVFCNADDFAEPITYYPRCGSGEGRSIDAVVIRDPLAIFPEDGDVVTSVFEVRVVNSDTLGIASTELNTGGDQVEFAGRIGKEAKIYSIVRIIEQDEGMLVLECR